MPRTGCAHPTMRDLREMAGYFSASPPLLGRVAPPSSLPSKVFPDTPLGGRWGGQNHPIVLLALCQGVWMVLRPRQQGPTSESPDPVLFWPWASPQDEESSGPSRQVSLEPVTSLPGHSLSTWDPRNAPGLSLGTSFPCILPLGRGLLICRSSAQRVANRWQFVGGAWMSLATWAETFVSRYMRPLAVWDGARWARGL